VSERERAVFRELVKTRQPEANLGQDRRRKIKKFYQDNALLDQQFVKDP